jgi:BSD domain
MWNALKADFQEFVSTVTEDTSNVLSKLDAGLDKDEDGVKDDDVVEDAESGDDDAVKNQKMANVVNHRELKEIMTLLRDHPGTYTEPLTDEDDKEAVDEYLKNFSIESKTDEIAEVLKEHEETVKKQFEELCPTRVSYSDFWTRYFYRCDEERIARQLAEETERARQARAEAFEAGVKSVTNFFGGAVAAVANTIAPEATDGEDGNSGGGINFFGAKGRPPFVMNTAVDESGDDELQGDEEEELGWDDDDEEDLGFDQDTPRSERTTEQIEFTDKVSEDLKEKLKQAIEERDQVQQTVQLQAEEIRSLRSKAAGCDVAETGNASEVENLKLALFEKDAEIAALKARVHDESFDDGKGAEQCDGGDAQIAALQLRVEQLTQALDSKEAMLKDSNDKLAKVAEELHSTRLQLSSDQASLQEASAAKQELEEDLKSAQVSLEASRLEFQQWKQTAERSQNDAATQLTLLQDNLSAYEQQVASLAAQLKEAQDKLEANEAATKKKDAALSASYQTGPPSTPDSYSTGVKLDTPAFTTPKEVATRLDSDDGEADGWGDDWSN